MGDIDEGTLAVYWWDGTAWEKLIPDQDGVTAVSVNPANVEFDLDDDGEVDKAYEGMVEIVSDRTGLFCLAGQQRPDITSEGAPLVSEGYPAPDEEVTTTLKYTLSDGFKTDEAAVSIVVSGQNDNPVTDNIQAHSLAPVRGDAGNYEITCEKRMAELQHGGHKFCLKLNPGDDHNMVTPG